jgi:hypothetical protein
MILTSGVFFVASDGVETRALTIVSNKTSVIVAVVPLLTVDMDYHVKVVTQYFHGGIALKKPKTAVFPVSLLRVPSPHTSF